MRKPRKKNNLPEKWKNYVEPEITRKVKNLKMKEFTRQWAIEKRYLGYNPLEI